MQKKNILVAPSLLAADFSRLYDAVRLVEFSGGDRIHIDVMDGSFVPDISFGPKLVSDIRPLTNLPFDVHLMVDRPEAFIPDFSRSGTNLISFHLESSIHVNRTIQMVKSHGCQVGIAIVPSTPVEALSEVIDFLDVVLVMTVDPGLKGQNFIPSCLNKISKLYSLRRTGGYHYLISVDGGVSRETAPIARDAGADVLVTGRSFFGARNPLEEVRLLRGDAS
jgi:ribulose-phosphate 3-epimerase